MLAIRAAANIALALPGFSYAPLAGKSALRALLRARVVSAREAGRVETSDGLLAEGMAGGLALSGDHLGAAMVADLAAADLSGNGLAPLNPGGPGLWLRAEPDHDAAQALTLAALVAEGMTA